MKPNTTVWISSIIILRKNTHTDTHTEKKKDTAATTGKTSVQTIHSKQLGGNNRVW